MNFVGRCKIEFGRTPPTFESVEPLEGEVAYVEVLGGRFKEIYLYQGSGWGTLAEAATISGDAYKAGTTIRLNVVTAK